MSHKPNYKVGDLVVDLGGMWMYIVLDVLDSGGYLNNAEYNVHCFNTNKKSHKEARMFDVVTKPMERYAKF
jgi:hypothetical protein